VVPLNFVPLFFMMVPSVNRHVYLGKKNDVTKHFSSMMVACCARLCSRSSLDPSNGFLPILGAQSNPKFGLKSGDGNGKFWAGGWGVGGNENRPWNLGQLFLTRVIF
jgi:hypothetical protein